FALEALSDTASAVAPGAAAAMPAFPSPRPRERWAWAGLVMLLVGVLAWFIAAARRGSSASASLAYRLILPLPENVSVNPLPAEPLRLAICPDGRRIAFVGLSPQRSAMIWIQSQVDSDSRALKGTESSLGPNWSPDCSHLSFASPGGGATTLKILDVGSG